MRKLKEKVCRECGKSYTPHKSLQKVCGLPCAINWSQGVQQEKKRKDEAKKHKADKLRIKTRSKWLKEAQEQFNRWVRLRCSHAGRPCISCQRHHKGQYHAGHFRPVGSAPERLRFEPDNCFRQCSACNNHLSGNLVAYRANLINLIGLERVEWLESQNKPDKLTVDEIKEIKEKYKLLGNQLAKEIDAYGL